MKILILPASLRKGSLNQQLANLMAKIGAKLCAVELLDFAEFATPLYNGDAEEKTGIPIPIQELVRRLKTANGLVIVSPEYNFSTPGTLKNLIDWVSRCHPMPLAGYPVMLAAASPAMVGGSRGLLHTLTTLQAGLGAQVFARLFTLALADKAFAENGELLDTKLQAKLEQDVAGFVNWLG